jgi:tRNA-specific 2-thiouridylase
MFVINLDRTKNQLVVGDRRDALVDSFKVREVTWTSSPIGGGVPHLNRMYYVEVRDGRGDTEVSVKVRHRAKLATAKVSVGQDGNLLVTLLEPQFAPAPGQSAVFYRGDEVLGGGIITRL